MKKIIPSVCFLWLCLMPALCFSQSNEWIIGDWNGGYFGEKSKLTKKFDSRLIITKVYGTVFEGVVQCILPSDTTIRLHTRISGRIYPQYLMTKLKEVVYFKDPPGQYTWAKHCFTCDSMKLTMVKRGDSVVLNGERKCDTLCNIIARYTKSLGPLVQKKPAATKPNKSSVTRTSLEMELAPATTPAPKTQEAVVAGAKLAAAQGQKTNGVINAPGKAPDQPTGKTPDQSATVAGPPPVPPAGNTSSANNPDRSTVTRTSLEMELAPATTPASNKAGAAKTNVVATQVQKTNGSTNTTGKATDQPTGNATAKAPVQQAGHVAGSASNPTAGHVAPQPPVATNQNTSPTKADNQTALGSQTPGIDRDNVYNASMPVRSGGVIFARPVLRDSISANYVVAGRNVVTSARFIVYADTAEVILMDNGIVDGDTVSLYYNGQIIVPKQELKIKPFSIKVPVYRGGTNILTVYAESLGTYPPNTAYVKLICGQKETSFLLSSTMSKSSSIELYRSDTNSD